MIRTSVPKKITLLMYSTLIYAGLFLAGCHHGCKQPVCGREIKLTPKLEAVRAAAADQLANARAVGKWTPQDRRSFDDKVKLLPAADDFELSRQLAVMISTNQVLVQREEQAPDRDRCCCVAGACKTTAALSGSTDGTGTDARAMPKHGMHMMHPAAPAQPSNPSPSSPPAKAAQPPHVHPTP